MAAKYGNKKIIVNGIVFDSKREANRYCELLLLQRARKIKNLELQKEYELIPAQFESYARYGKKGQRLKDGQRCIEQGVKYKADFVYTQNGKIIVEDTKGMRTKDYIIKRKLMLWRHGVKIREV